MGYKLWLTIALVIIIILFLASVIEYIPSNNGEPGRLSIVWQKNVETLPCTGELTLTSQNTGDGKCMFKVESVLKNCEKERWYVFKGNECDGTLICDGDVLVKQPKWACTWPDDPGTYTLTLCTGTDIKDSKSVTCY